MKNYIRTFSLAILSILSMDSSAQLPNGSIAPDFTATDINGVEYNLYELLDAGNVVILDFFATWCGPCLREIPALKILETDYHDKNIAFVSLSIDEVKDYDKWRTMIIEKKLKGIQLMADNNWKSKFVTDYGIKGIPRFIIIDIDGRIVNSDAPRPSNPEIRVILNELL